MPHWTVDAPASLEFDDITELNVRLIGGTVAVLATDEKPSLVVSELKGRPLEVDFSDGTLTISYPALSWERLLDFLKPHNDKAAVTVTVPANCPVQLGVVSASALVSGLSSGASVKGVSGDITLDGVAGGVEANTVSGELQARDIDGPVNFASVSGELTLADSSISALSAENVSGQVTADVTLGAPGGVDVSTVSGEVTLRLPDDTDAKVRLNSMSGKVQTEFGSLQVKKAPASRTVSGNVGAGTGHVSVTTVSGAITLLRRPDSRKAPFGGDNPPRTPPTYGGGAARRATARAGRNGERDPMSPVFRHGRLRLYLLRLLDEEPRHGYEVIRLLRDRFMGIYAPSPGTIYPRLARLEEEGLVTHDEENGRKVYRITEAGREELRKRGAELDELEEELSASVNDIVREVREDVRETVRSLREELTWAAREMRRGEREARDDVREHARAARDEAWTQARTARDQARGEAKESRDQTREETRQARDEEREQARQERDQARQERDAAREEWEQARRERDEARQEGDQLRDAREQARQARDEALRHAQRIKEEAANLRDDALGRFRALYEQAVGGRDPWAEGTREETASSSGENRTGGWGDWARWADWSGRKNWPGPGDAAAFRDLEHLAKDFASDLRKVAWDSGALGGETIGSLRDILADALERIKSEVFTGPEPADSTGATAPADSDSPADSSEQADDSATPGGTPENTGSASEKSSDS